MLFSVRFALAVVVSSIIGPHAAFASTREDTVDVDHLIAAYHEAVVEHDGARLAALFMPEGTAWFSALTDAGLARARARAPNAPKVRPGSVMAFVALVTNSKDRLDPQHSDLRIRTDGTVATVTFDFRFLINGDVQNSGIESWQLVKGDDGWRIVSIIYSSTPASN
ncbi:YybH family protein [Plastoroseomonas hellenica]|uniref:YybH family protein n=1 Tax=Plastoroseomonas hellenica TaxID=2687306 RepID=UPI001BA86C6B|nr:nuclear transport factor 2 family protein [Plastoroseomonas hellenica]MBR0642727.1 DUF4440 domain-containing protein [Plastoroseomonas hellenica]